jgi:hypothetical protein
MATMPLVQKSPLLGGSVPGVSFKIQEDVQVVAGPYTGIAGELISLYEIEPEPIYHLETRDGGDIHVRQSDIVAVS